MATYLLAFMLVGGIAVGDMGVKPAADKPSPPATARDLQLERAARDYRIQTYEAFHKDRAEYDRRQAEGARIQKAWTDAGRNQDELPKLVDWLEAATASSRTGSIGELPPAPQFTVMPQRKEAEKQLVETQAAASVDEAAAKVDSLLHVQPAGTASKATKSSAKEDATPHFRPSVIGSLPEAFAAEINRTLHGVSNKPAQKSP